MKTSQAGIDLIKKFEGCKLKAYRLPDEQYNTIGYGHYGPDVLDGMTISRERAEEYLRLDLDRFERGVRNNSPIELAQPQFDALVSYSYNRGLGGLEQLIKHCRTAESIRDGIVTYWGSKKRYKMALIKRRIKERDLFKSGMPKSQPTVYDIALEVIEGKWGTGEARKNALNGAGWDPERVQAEVNHILL